MAKILITGGARSGKSRVAEDRVLAMPGRPVYVATAQAFDAEMEQRIALHRARRDERWLQHDAPLDLVDALAATEGEGARLVDCLTLWLTNVMLGERDWQTESARLVEAIARAGSPVVFVTNEVGMGIVPDNRLARDFRDAQGRLNQSIAAIADEAWFVVSGLPMRLK